MARNAAALAGRAISRCREASAKLARCGQYKGRTKMAASSKLTITEAERRFPCRIKLGVYRDSALA
jgi:hypothetical protein